MKCCAEGCDCQATPGWYCLEHASIRANELMKIGKEVLAPSPTASELNQGKELTEERVRFLLDWWRNGLGVENIPEFRRYLLEQIELAEHWLSSSSSEAPSRRGEGIDPRHLRIAVQSLAFHLAMSQADRRPANPFDEERQAALDAIVEALNKNTGAS